MQEPSLHKKSLGNLLAAKSGIQGGEMLLVALLQERWGLAVGQVRHWLQLPGLVCPLDYNDPVTRQHISIRCSPCYTIIQIDSKEFFFLRESGRFDGTGVMWKGEDSMMPAAIARCREDCIQRSR